MRKVLCAVIAAALFYAGALAESGDFRAGADAAKLGGSLFFAVDEGATGALVRVGETPMLAARAEKIASLLAFDGDLYYLAESGGAWALMRREETTAPETVYAFDAGTDVRALSAYGSELFLLVDGRLHIVYPEQALCLRLAGAQMREYTVDGEYAYFVSAADLVDYELPSGAGTASAEAGCLYKLNLSTSNTSLVMKAGAENLTMRGGKLYFHNLADAYLQGTEKVAGRLYSLDITEETLTRELDCYDWAYCAVRDGILVYRQGGVNLVSSGGSETNVCVTGTRALVSFADGFVFVYDPDDTTFTCFSVPAP
jgi:hypothetical protein